MNNPESISENLLAELPFLLSNREYVGIPLEFRGMGRVGVECLDLYFPIEGAKPSQKNPEAFNAGKILSEYDSRELMLMALYLWNEGRSSLKPKERDEARSLLEKWDAPEQPKTAAVSG